MKGIVLIMLALVATGAMAANNDKPVRLAPREHAKPLLYFLETDKKGEVTRAFEGTRKFSLTYADEFDGGTIKAELNGVDVSALFHPPLKGEQTKGKGRGDLVELPVVEGDNLLEVTATPAGPDGLPNDDDAQIFRLTIHLRPKQPPRQSPGVTVRSSSNPADVELFVRKMHDPQGRTRR